MHEHMIKPFADFTVPPLPPIDIHKYPRPAPIPPTDRNDMTIPVPRRVKPRIYVSDQTMLAGGSDGGPRPSLVPKHDHEYKRCEGRVGSADSLPSGRSFVHPGRTHSESDTHYEASLTGRGAGRPSTESPRTAPSPSDSTKSLVPGHNYHKDRHYHQEKHLHLITINVNRNYKDSQDLHCRKAPREYIPHRPSAAQAPPQDGATAWLHVAAGFMLMFSSWGILNTFGVFQNYYESGALFKNSSSSNIAWIGAFQMFLVLFLGVGVGPLYDRGYLRSLLVVGCFCVVFGHMMLSLCTEFWQVVLAQGIVVGVGAGCLFVPCVSLLPTYFSRRIGLALGVAYSGSSLGGIIYPIVLYRLIGPLGFPWAVRVMGFLALGTFILPLMVMRVRVKPPTPRGFYDWKAFADMPYMALVTAIFLGMMGVMIFIIFVSFFSAERGILDTQMAFYLVPILNAGSCVGRILANALSDKIGPLNTMTPCATICGLLVFCLGTVESKGAVITLTLLGGFFSGIFISMQPPCFLALIKDKSNIGTRIGMGCGMVAFSLLVSGPGAGAILGRVPVELGKWKGVWAFSSACLSVAAFMFTGLRIYLSGLSLFVKV